MITQLDYRGSSRLPPECHVSLNYAAITIRTPKKHVNNYKKANRRAFVSFLGALWGGALGHVVRTRSPDDERIIIVFRF